MNPISTTIPVQAVVSVTDNGAAVTPSSIAWSSSDETIATVDAASGVVTPVGPGAAIITATCTVAIPNGGPATVIGTGTVTVTQVGDNLVATVDFQPIAAAA